MKLSVPRKVVLIGASTGGPGQIQKIIDSLPKLQDTTVVIAQHMVKGFMNSFTARLQDSSSNHIELVEDKQAFMSAKIYICESKTSLYRQNKALIFSKIPLSKESYNPDINILFNSFIPLSRDINILSVILTGIGADGVDACKNLSISGATCVTETEESAIVDGMPNRARDEVDNIRVHDIKEIIELISEFCE